MVEHTGGTDDDGDDGSGTDSDLDGDLGSDEWDVDGDQTMATGSDVELELAPIDTTIGEAALIATARRRHGALGGIVAAGMLGIDKVLGRKPREEIPVVVDAPTEPVDIDTQGITVPLDAHTDVISPPLPRTLPVVAPARRRRR